MINKEEKTINTAKTTKTIQEGTAGNRGLFAFIL